MKRLLFVIVVLALFVLPAYAAEPSGNWQQYPNISFTQPTGAGWYVTHIYHFPVGVNDLRHNLYVDTYNYTEWPNDDVTADIQVPVSNIPIAFWCTDEPNPVNFDLALTWYDKPANEDGVNFPIYKNQTCKVTVYDGRPSGIVSGITTALPDEGDDVKWGHHSWRVYFTYIEPEVTPTSTPPPTPTNRPTPTPAPTWTPVPTATMIIDIENAIRNAAWNKVGVNYNPDAAFAVYARSHGLGAPLSNEFDYYGYRAQPFMGGVVFAMIGDWQNTRHLAW